MLIHEYLHRSAALYPDKIALVCGQSRLTYRTISENATRLAGFLLEKGIGKGDRVAVYLDNCPEAVISIFGILEAGGCFIAVNHTTRSDGLGFILQNSGARFLIAPAGKLETIREAEIHFECRPLIILTGEGGAVEPSVKFDDICTSAHLPAGRGDRIISLDCAAIIYTSGSTGKPKGVTLTHLNIDTVVESVVGYLENTENDIILCLLQLSFGYGLLQLLATFRTGGTLVLEKGYGYPFEIVKKIVTEKVTGFAGAPTLFAMLLQLQNLEREDFSGLRYVTNAAAALPLSFVPKLRKVFPTTKIYLMHGLTECLRTTYLPPDEVEQKPNSVGKGMANVELWIEGADGSRLGSGETGEMVVRGANVMQGYWNDPEGTSAVVKPGRFPWERILHTRDLFRQDSDGYFYFVARMDDIIKCRGEKVSPLEIENVLYSMDEVLESRVIGVPDEILGQAIRAEIVLKAGRSLTEHQVKAYIRSRLEDFKIPKFVAFVPSLPKSAGGKIKRTAAADQ